MDKLHLSDIGWILVCLAIYLVATSALPGWFLRQVQPRHARPTRRRPPLRRRVMSRPVMRTALPISVNPNAGVRAEIPLLNGAEPQLEPFANPAELALNAQEVIAVARMIDHNRTAAKPSKSNTIAAGFGVSRGGSPVYVRASAIYDALFGAPAPAVKYRELTPEQERVRAQLMKQKGVLN